MKPAESPDPEAVREDLANLAKHIENVTDPRAPAGGRPEPVRGRFGRGGRRSSQTFASKQGVTFSRHRRSPREARGRASLPRSWSRPPKKGASSGLSMGSTTRIREKVDKVVEKMYGGSGVSYTEAALAELEKITS